MVEAIQNVINTRVIFSYYKHFPVAGVGSSGSGADPRCEVRRADDRRQHSIPSYGVTGGNREKLVTGHFCEVWWWSS